MSEFKKKMKSFDKFINSVRTEVAKRFDLKTDSEIDAFFIGMEESAKDFQEALEKRDKMLRETVAELCEAKRLLKAAVEALNDGSCNKDCRQCENCKSCDYDGRFKWKHTNEVLKLIGEDGDAK